MSKRVKDDGRSKKPCLVPDCPRKVHQRGLCQVCLEAAHEAMRTKQVTEEELIADNLIEPRQKRGPKPKPKLEFATALAARKSAKKKPHKR
jgi:hypothetical protein